MPSYMNKRVRVARDLSIGGILVPSYMNKLVLVIEQMEFTLQHCSVSGPRLM